MVPPEQDPATARGRETRRVYTDRRRCQNAASRRRRQNVTVCTPSTPCAARRYRLGRGGLSRLRRGVAGARGVAQRPRDPQRGHGPDVPAPEGQHPALPGPGAARGDARRRRPAARNGFLDLARVEPTLEDAAMLWIGDFVELFENGRPLAEAARVTRPACRCRPTGRSPASTRPWRTLTAPPLPDDTELYWQHGVARRRVRLSDPVRPVALRDPTRPDAARPARQRGDCGSIAAGRRRARLRHPRRPRHRRLDPRWHQAAFRFVERRVLPHPRRHRPPAVPVLPRDSVPPPAAAGGGRDRLHGGAFDHPHRLGVRHGADGVVVSAAHRDADCRLDRLHGDREHHRRPPRSAAGS